MSQFSFLQSEWPAVYDAAGKAESAVYSDPRTACFYARRALELAIAWLYKHDSSLKLPYQDNLSALIHEPTFKMAAGETVFCKTRVVTRLGNEAVHSTRQINQYDAVMAVKELFHIGYWLARTYSRDAKPVTFNQELIPKAAPVPKQTAEQLQKLETGLRERDEKLSVLLADKTKLDEELKRLRIEVEAAKRASTAQPDTHDYSEAETRDYFIDLLLRESGWPLVQERDREFKVTGMPNAEGVGFVDYVLWGDDGKPLAIIETKRTKKDARIGQHQAVLYADCLEKMFGRRPIIFYSNGYDHWIWDDVNYPPRKVQGFYKKAELELLIQRRTTRKPLKDNSVNEKIVERPYQTRAIRRICEAFENDKERKALVVMATGAGKTRTVIALSDLLMRCNYVKRVLFLADRKALVKQAVNAFKKHLPDSSPVNLVTEKDTEGRVFVSTYPTMMGLIDETLDGQRRFGSGHFDLVIIDEAHRSVFQKYRAIFEYFDSLLVGLTATPKDEVDRNTYSLFDLENGVPTDAYPLEEAVKDKFLVPARAVSVPLKFQREGIKYKDLSEDEKDLWDALEWETEGGIPKTVEPEALNKWLFNKDTVDKVIAHLMTHGLKVAGGDRLGKTIIFAKNTQHAEYIAERFNINYPHYKGKFARVVTYEAKYAESIIDDFYKKNGNPHIAISVDMLDTGIDVPEVVNLVFFKLVRSKTKFWQMIGRGTRLCPALFTPYDDKEFFYLFDYCQNLEYFSQETAITEGSLAESLGTRLFKSRLELIGELDKKIGDYTELPKAADSSSTFFEPSTDIEIRRDIAALLHTEVKAMNLDNFVVRPRRRLVEKYSKPESWFKLKSENLTELSHEIAGLPAELEAEEEEAKRFDLLLLNLELSQMRAEPAFERLRDQVKSIAGLLEEKSTIPKVKAQMPLILDVQTSEWWENANIPMLEKIRRRLRNLISLIEKRNRKPIYIDVEDEMGEGKEITLPGFTSAGDFEKFKEKARAFLRDHQDHEAVRKLRMNEALTPKDLAELEQLLADSGIGDSNDITRAKSESHGLGIFVRSLVGLDREAAKKALAKFLSGKNMNANQIEFATMIVEHLTEHGVMDASLLYESPFTDITPKGPDGIFNPTQIDELFMILQQVQSTAVVAA